jgi:transcriptional regulator with XRE-family HTH domain
MLVGKSGDSKQGRSEMTRSSLVAELVERRRALGMSYAVLAARSGISTHAARRVLCGESTSDENVRKVAEALGCDIGRDERESVETLLRTQAARKAERLVSLVQGTSALEGQAVGAAGRRRMVERTIEELLSGPRRRLWSED